MIPTFIQWLAQKGLSEDRLTAADRDAMPKKDFVFPKEKRYPIEDPEHGRNALSRVSQFGSPSEKKKVRAAVHRKFPSIGEN